MISWILGIAFGAVVVYFLYASFKEYKKRKLDKKKADLREGGDVIK